MNTTGKIIVAGIVGTTFMTMFSYLVSRKAKEQYREPELLNTMIDRSESLPSTPNKEVHPAGWAAHYVIGILFVLSYRLLWKRSLTKPTLAKTLLIGGASGTVGIVSWKIFFSEHDNPPQNDRQGYYRHLFFAHIIFGASSILTYKMMSPDKALALKE